MDIEIEKTCCFTGSRPQKLSYGFNEKSPECLRLKALLRQEAEDRITFDGVTRFISGMALGVDQWAAEIVLELKESYPHIILEAAVPCESQAQRWNPWQQKRYKALLSRCDVQTLVQREYTPDCMHKRNRYMVDQSAYVLAVWAGGSGGTAATVRYAGNLGRKITCIDPETLEVREIQALKDLNQ